MPLDKQVRPLLAAEAEPYRALMLRAYADHPMEFTSTVAERQAEPLDWWARRIGSPQAMARAFGAFFEGRLVGSVAMAFEAREKVRHKADLIGMYVAQDARGSGAGRALVHAVLDAARQRAGVRQVLLTVTEGNRPALALYESCGFKAFGIEPRAVFADGAFRGKIHMWRDLETAS